MVINKFPNREVYEKIKAKGSLGADDVNVLEDYPGPELTEADKTEIAEIVLEQLGGPSGFGGALKAMSAVSGYIGIPAAELPENGVVWMCFGSGDSTELYTGTVTMQDAWIAVNDMLMITNEAINPLNQVSLVSDGLAIYGLSTRDYRGVYQVVGAGGALRQRKSRRTASKRS